MTPDSVPSLKYPALHATAAAASRHGRESHTRLVMLDLALLGAAAVIGIASTSLLPLAPDWAKALAAALLALGLLAKLANRLRSYDEQWFDGRAVAETVKSASWRYAMHVPPYNGTDADADTRLLEVLRDAITARPALAGHLHQMPADGQQITPSMRQIRALPLTGRKTTYLSSRMNEQISWYSSKAAANARQATRWFWVGFAAQGGALLVAIALVARPETPDFVAGLAAITAVAAAWSQFRRHDELSKSYALAAQELSFLRNAIEVATTEEAFEQAIANTEAAVSREHTMWMARRG